MDIVATRNELRLKSIYDMPLRVVYYARVSTEKDEQVNSLNNQQKYYDDFIGRNENWIFEGGYVDEGLSAITTTKRENFHRMIADAKAGKFDFIITKEITRFARNTLDSIKFTRELLNCGVAVFFQNDNINTIDEDSELRLTIMSGIAQDEVRKISSRIKFGHSQAIKNGVVMGNSKIYGYKKESGKLVVDEEQAKMINLIFELYATGDHSTPSIEKILYEKGFRNTKGGAINRRNIGMIIKNPKYKGYYCGKKVQVVDMFTKKQKFLDEDEWVMYKDENAVPQIVDEELWNKANNLFKMRSEEVKNRRTSFKTDNLYTGKLICKEHNAPFYLKARKNKKGETNSTWVCSHRIKNGKDSCDTFAVRENELTEITMDILSNLSNDIDSVVDKYINFLKNNKNEIDFDKEFNTLNEKIESIESKKDKLLELSLEGMLTNDEFGKRNNKYNEEINSIEKEVKKLEALKSKDDNSVDGFKKLKKELRAISNLSKVKLTSGIINTFINKIEVTAESENHLNLVFFINTGKTVEKTVGRSGNTFKKMIEAEERKMSGQN